MKVLHSVWSRLSRSPLSLTVCHRSGPSLWRQTAPLFHSQGRSNPPWKVTCSRIFSTKVERGEAGGLSAEEQLENLDNAEKIRLEKLKVEVELMRAKGEFIPPSISPEQWLDLLDFTSRNAVRKELNRVARHEYVKQKKAAESVERQEKHLQRKERIRKKVEEEGYVNTFNLFIRPETMKKHYENNLFYAMLNGPNVVIDMEMEKYMSRLELSDLGTQINQCYGFNKRHPDPVHIHLCGLKRDSRQYKQILRHLHAIESSPITISEESYIDLYPRDKLVYLSPHSRRELKTFEEDSVYIIGGMVDRSAQKPVTWTKAKDQGIRSAKFPLDRYLRWGTGASKCLAVNHSLSVLLDFRHTGDWNEAFKHIPQRKLLY